MSFKPPKKIDFLANRSLLLIAAGLVMICQLVALALVAEGQVHSAGKRESMIALQRLSVAECMERSMEPGRSACVQQARGIYVADAIAPHEAIMPNTSFAPRYLDGSGVVTRAPGERVVGYAQGRTGSSTSGGMIAASFTR